jgi:hypothetical protein
MKHNLLELAPKITEQELINVMFLNDDGQVSMKLLNIENPAVADATHSVSILRKHFIA